MRRSLLFLSMWISACSPSGGDSSGSGSSEATTSTTASMTTAPTTTAAPTTTGGSQEVVGLELMGKLAGLWTGPATMTPLGDFPIMNMDFRAASGHVLFGRVDLDAANNLRFAFEVEDHGAGPQLVYRNGGYFLGILRDSRALLESFDGTTWRFCSAAQGCGYIDARFTFPAEDHVVLDVDVKGQQHLTWDAKRSEPRALPEPFPSDLVPDASDAPFPTMPTLKVDVTWSEPLPQDGEVWVILATKPCDVQLGCVHSRSLRAAATAGAVSATLLFDQIHPGAYKMTALLDRNGNLAETLFPDMGDGLSLPNQAVQVAPSGESTAKAAIVVTL